MTLPQRSQALSETGAVSIGLAFCNFGRSIPRTSAQALEPCLISSSLQPYYITFGHIFALNSKSHKLSMDMFHITTIMHMLLLV